ncbi:MAG TPA: hypothetical protein PK668_01890 [Myxococcota bacterium]|nr:hypothetical protein [Myxococcota bacterium]HRY94681.1 hypothetical protein [Myxococcota bacterium]HSA22094.1 hypothetical protein [Myxococcota bacterium]
MPETCGLCGQAPIAPGELEIAGLRLCAECHAGRLKGRLAPRGLVLRERRWIEDRGEHQRTVYVIELCGGVPFRLELQAELCGEGLAHKLAKVFKREVQTGDPDFDPAVYIDTRTREDVAAALGSPGLRAAVLELLSEDVRLLLDGNTACVTVAGTLSNRAPRAGALQRDLALVLHHLAARAAELGLPPRPVSLAGYPGSTHSAKPEHDWG